MELRHLVAFDAVVQHAQITRAARQLSMPASLLSRQILALEDELHVKLFSRHGHSMALTPAGREFHVYVRRILQLVENAKISMSDHAGLMCGIIRLAVPPCASILAVPKMLAGFSRNYPQLTIQLCDISSSEIPTALLTGEIDIGLLSSAITDPRLAVKVIQQDELVLALPSTHPLSRKGSLDLRELKSERWIIPPVGTDIRDTLYAACKAAGFTPKAIVQGGNLPTILQCIMADIGITLLPARAVEGTPGVTGLTISEQRHPICISIVTAADALSNPAISVLHDHLESLYTSSGGQT